MADYRHEFVEPAIAASQINAWVPVRGLGTASSRDEYIMPVAASSQEAIGMSIATVASPGDAAAFVFAGRAKGIAAASLGAFAHVGANASGLLGPITPGLVGSFLQQYQVGISVEAAVAGQVFTIIVKPEQFF
jgi:hypothetical protein